MGLPHDTSEPRSQQFSVQHRGRRRANSGSHAKFSSAVAASPAQQMHPIHLMFLEVAILWMNQKKMKSSRSRRSNEWPIVKGS